MKRCWFQSRCRFVCTAQRPRNAMMKASLSNNESCDDEQGKGENTKTVTAS